MSNGSETGEGGMLTRKEATKRLEGKMRSVQSHDLTGEIQPKNPLKGDEAARVDIPTGDRLAQKQREVGLAQLKEEAEAYQDANPSKPAETPGKKLGRIARGETR